MQKSASKVAIEDKYYNLIDNWIGKGTTIITLNYDTLLESMIHSIHSDVDLNMVYCTDFIRDGGTGKGSRINSVPQLLKLHGSINWYYPSWGDDNSQIYYDDNYSDHRKKLKSFKNDSFYPFIIPPTYLKQDCIFHDQIIKIWSYTREAIQKHTDIIVIGYSLPPSDIAIRNLFSGAVFPHCKSKSKKIYIVNPDKTVADRFKELVGEKHSSLIEHCEDISHLSEKVLSL